MRLTLVIPGQEEPKNVDTLVLFRRKGEGSLELNRTVNLSNPLDRADVSLGVLEDASVYEVEGPRASLDELLSDIGLGKTIKLVGATRHDRDDVELCAPLAATARVFCVGRNYQDHVDELGSVRPEAPVIFQRGHASLVGDRSGLRKPSASDHYDFEGELAIVIGRPARSVAAADAHRYIAGYTLLMDGSIRDFQKHSFVAGKNFDGSGSCGPGIKLKRTEDAVRDFRLKTTLNGNTVQSATSQHLLFSIPELVRYVSTFTQLLPGDVISTGTPGGVGAGRTPPLWMKAGDSLVVEVSGVGRLENTVVDETR